MPLFPWSDDLSVKVTLIDDQHKKLIALINSLHDAMRAGEGKQVLEKTLKELADYTVYHFQTEEKYMQAVPLPDLSPAQGAARCVCKESRRFPEGSTRPGVSGFPST